MHCLISFAYIQQQQSAIPFNGRVHPVLSETPGMPYIRSICIRIGSITISAFHVAAALVVGATVDCFFSEHTTTAAHWANASAPLLRIR